MTVRQQNKDHEVQHEGTHQRSRMLFLPPRMVTIARCDYP